MISFLFSQSRSLPLEKDASSRLLPWLIALMVFLASLAMVVAFTMGKIAGRWENALSKGVTIQVPSGGSVNERSLTLRQIEILAGQLREAEGVESVRVMDDSELAKMLTPWLGEGLSLRDLPVPYLIAVELNSLEAHTLDKVRKIVETSIPDAFVDDHQRWMNSLLNLARTVKFLAFLTVFLVSGAAVVMVILVTRMSLAIHHNVVELFHQMGAYDGFIASRFQRHSLRLGLLGGLMGLLLTGSTIALMSYFMGQANTVLIPRLTLSTLEWLALLSLPASAGVIAMITARSTVMKVLQKMP